MIAQCPSGALLAQVATAQQATGSDADLVRQGSLVLASAHGDKPRYGGEFSVLVINDCALRHAPTSFGGVLSATRRLKIFPQPLSTPPVPDLPPATPEGLPAPLLRCLSGLP